MQLHPPVANALRRLLRLCLLLSLLSSSPAATPTSSHSRRLHSSTLHRGWPNPARATPPWVGRLAREVHLHQPVVASAWSACRVPMRAHSSTGPAPPTASPEGSTSTMIPRPKLTCFRQQRHEGGDARDVSSNYQRTQLPSTLHHHPPPRAAASPNHALAALGQEDEAHGTTPPSFPLAQRPLPQQGCRISPPPRHHRDDRMLAHVKHHRAPHCSASPLSQRLGPRFQPAPLAHAAPRPPLHLLIASSLPAAAAMFHPFPEGACPFLNGTPSRSACAYRLPPSILALASWDHVFRFPVQTGCPPPLLPLFSSLCHHAACAPCTRLGCTCSTTLTVPFPGGRRRRTPLPAPSSALCPPGLYPAPRVPTLLHTSSGGETALIPTIMPSSALSPLASTARP